MKESIRKLQQYRYCVSWIQLPIPTETSFYLFYFGEKGRMRASPLKGLAACSELHPHPHRNKHPASCFICVKASWVFPTWLPPPHLFYITTHLRALKHSDVIAPDNQKVPNLPADSAHLYSHSYFNYFQGIPRGQHV